MTDKHSASADEDSALIRRQILICLLGLLIRPSAELHPKEGSAKQSGKIGA